MSRLFLDNDVIAKLASIDLLDEAIEVLVGSSASLHTTADFKYWWRGKAKKHTAATCARVDSFLQRVVPLPGSPDPDRLATLSAVSRIDPGEAVLLAVAAEDSAVILTTGDKNCVRALGAASSCVAISANLAGRIALLEQVLLRLIEVRGFSFVLHRVVDCLPLIDTALRAVFGSGPQSMEENVRATLEGYIDEVRGDAGLLLLA